MNTLSRAAWGLAATLLPAPALAQTCTFEDQGNLIVMEVESAPDTGQWVFETIHAGYTGDGYYRWVGGNHFNNPGNGTMSYTFEVDTAGFWQFRIRNYHTNPDDTLENDVWARMDGGPWKKTFSNGAGTVNNWNYVTRFEEPDGTHPIAKYNLQAGEHTLEISARSFNYSIDRIHLYRAMTVQEGENSSSPESPCAGASLGTIYCDTTANSTGAPAEIFASGSLSVAANDLVFTASPVPDDFGVFFYGNMQLANVPFGDGFRCVGGSVFRFPPALAVNNTLEVATDNTNLPPGGGFVATLTRNFQAWYRDPAAGGAGFNLSTAVSVTFEP